MPQHEDIKLLGSIAAAEKQDELEQATDDDVQDGHKLMAASSRPGTRRYRQLGSLALHLIEYLHPTGSIGRAAR